MIKVCKGCGSEFEESPRRPGERKQLFDKRMAKRFCTQRCWITHFNKTDRDHAVAGGHAGGAVIIEKLRGSGKGYIKEYGVHQHRRVAERMLGRPLDEEEVVHHIDGDPQNNDPNNLIVLPNQAAHAALHAEVDRAEA